MADTKISAEASGGTAQAADEYRINRGGANFKQTPAQLAAWLFSGTATGALAIANGGTGQTSAPAAYNALTGYTTTATAGGTTTLTNASSMAQFFTGTLTQTVVLPVVSTLALGWEFEIINLGTQSIAVNSSGGNLVATVLAGQAWAVDCVLVTGTSAASWQGLYAGGTSAPSGGGTPGGSTTQVQFNNAGAFAGASGITTTGTEILIASGTQTVSTPVVRVTQTWNAGGVTFTANDTNVTDTASAAGSYLETWRVGGVVQASIRKDGSFTLLGINPGGGSLLYWSNNSNGLYAQSGKSTLGSAYSWNWSNAGPYSGDDLALTRQSAGILKVAHASGTTGGAIVTATCTVANLPTGVAGARAFVTDATVAASGNFAVAVTGGGANNVPVYHDGTSWKIG